MPHGHKYSIADDDKVACTMKWTKAVMKLLHKSMRFLERRPSRPSRSWAESKDDPAMSLYDRLKNIVAKPKQVIRLLADSTKASNKIIAEVKSRLQRRIAPNPDNTTSERWTLRLGHLVKADAAFDAWMSARAKSSLNIKVSPLIYGP